MQDNLESLLLIVKQLSRDRQELTCMEKHRFNWDPHNESGIFPLR